MHMSNHASETKGFNDVRLLIIQQKKEGKCPLF